MTPKRAVKKPRPTAIGTQLGLRQTQTPPPPSFAALLSRPLVKLALPTDFSAATEADHLCGLWTRCTDLHKYTFFDFVHAGGSGMVFRVRRHESPTDEALKIARAKLFGSNLVEKAVGKSLSPVEPRELKALQRVAHQNIVRLFDVVADAGTVVGISTTYVPNPQPLDAYLQTILASRPRRDPHPFSAERLDKACAYLVARLSEVASALAHMHALKIFHLDIKPANILLSKSSAMLTDFGSCVHRDELQDGAKYRVHFTWTYAHPRLSSIVSDPRSISGGGLKASAELDLDTDLAVLDLFSLGRTVQEALALLEEEFGARCYGAPGFRFLHVLACRLLDGRNAAGEDESRARHGRKFVSDTALGYHVSIFAARPIRTAVELEGLLARFTRERTWYLDVPELDPWHSEIINAGLDNAPFTKRVSALFSHPVLRRLKGQLQLGWIKEVYPGATHNRWAHTLGVFSSTVQYYGAILSDPEVPTFRLFAERADIETAFVAAILHDVGQATFAHDVEAACPELYRHEDAVSMLLDETYWGSPTLRECVQHDWPLVHLDRVLRILARRYSSDADEPSKSDIVDGIAMDVVNGPIDADKIDYVRRDAIACAVPYGLALDSHRFLRSLSVSTTRSGRHRRLRLAYKAKGAAAVEAVLLARYQMYGAVYWHHTFRCIQAMFTHAAAASIGSPNARDRLKIRNALVNRDVLKGLFYDRVICGKPYRLCRDRFGDATAPKWFEERAPASVASEPVLEFFWKLASNPHRTLIERLANRELYKRVFELKLGQLGGKVEYAVVQELFAPSKRVAIASAIEDALLVAISKAMVQRGPRESISESDARRRLAELEAKSLPRVVVDFPIRGVPEPKDFPPELDDASRKYTAFRRHGPAEQNISNAVIAMQKAIAAVRVFAAKELHELVVRYLPPDQVAGCVSSVVPALDLQSE